jgi:hypothetical protein
LNDDSRVNSNGKSRSWSSSVNFWRNTMESIGDLTSRLDKTKNTDIFIDSR